jgi:DNA-binding response OmpR family regulator
MAEGGRSKRVLVVDDDPAILRIYSAAVAQTGAIVDVASDGQVAFRLATTRDYALVLMDINMPNWNGVDAIRSLRMLKPELPIAVISANLQIREYREAADELGIAAELAKPVSLAALSAFVRKQLG